MNDDATSSQSEGRPARRTDEAPRWRWAFRTTEDQVLSSLEYADAIALGLGLYILHGRTAERVSHHLVRVVGDRRRPRRLVFRNFPMPDVHTLH
jgi:hypothetical protein